MDLAFAELVLAAIVYAFGGLCMKFSAGLTRPLPTFLLYSLFALGATLQTLGMRRADLGVAYIIVLGLEAIVALGLSVLVLEESCSPARLAAVGIIVAGIVWLRLT